MAFDPAAYAQSLVGNSSVPINRFTGLPNTTYMGGPANQMRGPDGKPIDAHFVYDDETGYQLVVNMGGGINADMSMKIDPKTGKMTSVGSHPIFSNTNSGGLFDGFMQDLGGLMSYASPFLMAAGGVGLLGSFMSGGVEAGMSSLANTVENKAISSVAGSALNNIMGTSKPAKQQGSTGNLYQEALSKFLSSGKSQ